MKIEKYFLKFLYDLETFEPNTLTDIVRLVKSHQYFNHIVLFAKNSTQTISYIQNQVQELIDCNDPIADIQLCSVAVILSEINLEYSKDLLSRTVRETPGYYWSQAMAISCLLNKEIINETICQSS